MSSRVVSLTMEAPSKHNSSAASIPIPPPPSPAIGRPMSNMSPSALYMNHHKSPHLAAALGASPPISPTTTTTLPGGGVPFMPNLVLASSTSACSKSAMEHCLEQERQRRLEKERLEAGMDDPIQLHALLKEERIRMARIAAELAVMKAVAAASQMESEVNEEGRINGLMRKLDQQQHYYSNNRRPHRPEEMTSSLLQSKLDQVQKEKSLLEQQALQQQFARLGGNPIQECGDEEEDAVDDDLLPDLAGSAGAMLDE